MACLLSACSQGMQEVQWGPASAARCRFAAGSGHLPGTPVQPWGGSLHGQNPAEPWAEGAAGLKMMEAG